MCFIPVLDFETCNHVDASHKEKEKLSSELVKVLSDTGFVYLRNHGISSDAINEVNEVTRLFFESPLHLKNNFTKNRSVFGYVGVQEEKLDPSKYPGYKEVFNISGCFLDSKDKTQWPDDLSPKFSATITNFMEKCKSLALKILDVLAIGLNLDTDYFRKNHSLIHQNGNYTALRSLYYPPLPENMNAVKTRLGEHSDYGSITLLFQDEVGGLQVQCANGSYIEATPIKDTVLINIGDALQYWTKGKLKSTKHKVDIPSDMQKRMSVRRSIAYFVQPNNDVILDIGGTNQKQFSDLDKNAIKKPATYLNYLESKLSDSFDEPQNLN